MKKKSRAFTLIEVLIALSLILLIAIFIFPALSNIMRNTGKSRNDFKEIYALEAVLEGNKKTEISSFTSSYNGYEIQVEITPYDEGSDGGNLRLVRCKSDNYELQLVVGDL